MTLAFVFTPQAGLGELLREALASAGVEVQTFSEARFAETDAIPDVLVVDGAIAAPDEIAALVAFWRERNPDVRVVWLPSQEDDEAFRNALAPDLVFGVPFYMPDFLAALQRWFGAAEERAETAPKLPPRPPWLQEVSVAAQHLARLSLETAAQAAALVTTEGRLWAYAGELPQPAAEELARLAAHYWEGGGSVDFARFLRLEAVQQDFLLYATAVTADLVLAMLFDVRVPFSRIRTQAGHLAEALARQQPESAAETESPAEQEDAPPPPATVADVLAEKGIPLPPEVSTAHPPQAEPAAPPDEQREEVAVPEEEAFADLPPEANEPLFDDVPPPEPESGMSKDAQTASTVSVAVTVRPDVETDLLPGAPAVEEASLPAPLPSYATVQYAFVLIPRFPQHTLAGDLARDLSRWMPQIALAFGWRLLHLAVRPAYIQWIVQAPPETSPAEVLRTVRRRTSERIFAAYPRLAETNPSGHFWAPGYLLLSQNQPIPEETIQAFIAATRRHQGLAGGE